MSEINMAFDEKRLITKLNKKPYYSHIFMCLLGVCFMSWFYYGKRAIVLIALSAAVSFFTELISLKLSGKEFSVKDVSAIESGIILALLMPASLPYEIMAVSAFMMILIGKVAFGGIKNQIFPSAAVGFALASICWSEYVLVYPAPVANGELPLSSHINVTLSESFTRLADSVRIPAVSSMDLMLGAFTGPMGTTCILLLVICAVTFICRATASRMVIFSSLSVIFIFQYLFPTLGNGFVSSMAYELLSGSTLFIVLFIACDPATVPEKRSARLIFGLLVGLFTVLFRRAGGIENAAVFGVLAACLFVDILDRYFYRVSDFLAYVWSKRKNIKLFKQVKTQSEKKKNKISSVRTGDKTKEKSNEVKTDE